MSPVISAPAPDTTVNAMRTTVAQSKIVFHRSTGIEETLLNPIFIPTVAFIGVSAFIGAIVAAVCRYSQIMSHKKWLDKAN